MKRIRFTLCTMALCLAGAPAWGNHLCLQMAGPDQHVRQAIGAALVRQQLPVDGPQGSPCDVEVTVRTKTTGYRLSAKLAAGEDGRHLAEEEVSGSTDQVFDLVDRLGQRLARDLGSLSTPGTVAVLPFDNQASTESHAFVSGIPQMLLTTLRQQRQWTLIEAPGSSAAGVEAQADVAITGRFTEALSVELTAAVVATGVSLGQFEAIGPRADLGPWLDGLAAELAEAVEGHRRTLRTVAVLPFLNHGDQTYGRFVNGLADMLTTSLGQSPRLTIIERVQIETAMANFDLELSGPIDSETAVRVGAWLGADAVVVGSFLRFGSVFRIDARMIDAQTGEVLIADRASGAEDAVMNMVDELGHKLVERFEDRVPTEAVGTGTLEVAFRMRKAEMGERPCYFHLCKLYVDGQYVETSPVVRKLDSWVPLFSRPLSSGPHRVQLVHGYVSESDWDGNMPLQPEPFAVTIEPGSTATLRYTYEVGWFKDRYVMEH